MTHRRPLQFTVLATALLATVWMAPSLLDPINLPKLSLLLIGALGLVGLLAGYAKQWWEGTELPLVIVTAVFVVGLTAAALASDQASYRTLWGVWARNTGWIAYAALAIIFLAAGLAFRGTDARWALYGLATAGTVQVLYGLLQVTGNDPVAWNNPYNSIIGTLGNPNFASALMGIAATALVWMALDARHMVWLRVAAGVTALVGVALTTLSTSIQGTLAFGVGAAVLLAVWLGEAQRSPSIRRLLLPSLGVGAVGGVVGVLGLLNIGPLAPVLFSQNLLNRVYYWKAALNMFRQDPLFGVGLDAYGDWYRIVRLPEQVAATGANVSSNAAHNVYLQLLGTGGLALFVPFVLVTAFVGWRLVVAVRNPDTRLVAGALGGSWLAFQAQSLFSIDQLGLTVWGWVLGGAIVAVSMPVPAAPQPTKRKAKTQSTLGMTHIAAWSAAAIFAIIGVAIAAGPWGTERQVARAAGLQFDPQNAQQAALAKQQILDATQDVPDPFWRWQGIQRLLAAGFVDDGIALAEASTRDFPLDLGIWNGLAQAYESTNRKAQAVAARAKTVELDPLNEEYRKLLAEDRAA